MYVERMHQFGLIVGGVSPRINELLVALVLLSSLCVLSFCAIIVAFQLISGVRRHLPLAIYRLRGDKVRLCF